MGGKREGKGGVMFALRASGEVDIFVLCMHRRGEEEEEEEVKTDCSSFCTGDSYGKVLQGFLRFAYLTLRQPPRRPKLCIAAGQDSGLKIGSKLHREGRMTFLWALSAMDIGKVIQFRP